MDVTPDGSELWLADQFAGSVSVIDTTLHSVIVSIPSGGTPAGVALSPDGTRLDDELIVKERLKTQPRKGNFHNGRSSKPRDVSEAIGRTGLQMCPKKTHTKSTEKIPLELRAKTKRILKCMIDETDRCGKLPPAELSSQTCE